MVGWSGIVGGDDGGDGGKDGGKDHGKDDGKGCENDTITAVSAQGEGTIKLVGIVEVFKRVLEKANNEEKQKEAEGKYEKEEGEEREGKAEEKKQKRFFLYTTLSSVTLPRSPPHQHQHQHQQLHHNHDHDRVDTYNVNPVNPTIPPTTKSTPVLTLWISPRRLHGWTEGCGGEEVVLV